MLQQNSLDGQSAARKLRGFLRTAAPAAAIVAIGSSEWAIRSLDGLAEGHGGLVRLAMVAGFPTVVEFVRALLTKHHIKEGNRELNEERREEQEAEDKHNQHLTAAAGDAIGGILRKLDVPESFKTEINKIAERTSEYFKAVSAMGLAPDELGDGELSNAILAATEGKFGEWGELGMWMAIIKMMATEADAVIEESVLKRAAQACQCQFIQRFFETIETDLSREQKNKGAAYASVHLRMMGEVLALAREGKDVSATHLSALKRMNEEIGNSRILQLENLRVSDEIHTKINELPKKVVDAIEGRLQPSPVQMKSLLPPRNEAFIGRTADLDKLDLMLNNPEGPRTIAIVAGAGLGKTELVKQYVHVRAQKPHQDKSEWIGRWWLDASRGGVDSSSANLFRAVMGRQKPEDMTFEKLRESVVERLSAARHLLILDNAQDAEQIKAWRLNGEGRVVATTRWRTIPPAVAKTFELDLLEMADATAILKGDRKDLDADECKKTLAEIAEHLGRHALGVAFAAAALARVPPPPPVLVLNNLQATNVGDEKNLLSDINVADLGAEYRLGLAQSLALLLDELNDATALQILAVAAFCHCEVIPLEVFHRAIAASENNINEAMRQLHTRSIIRCGDSVSLHRLTQSLARGRLRAMGMEAWTGSLSRLLDGLVGLFAGAEQLELYTIRAAAWPHAESAIKYTGAVGPDSPIPAKTERLHAELAEYLQLVGQLRAAEGHVQVSIEWDQAQTLNDESASRSHAGKSSPVSIASATLRPSRVNRLAISVSAVLSLSFLIAGIPVVGVASHPFGGPARYRYRNRLSSSYSSTCTVLNPSEEKTSRRISLDRNLADGSPAY